MLNALLRAPTRYPPGDRGQAFDIRQRFPLCQQSPANIAEIGFGVAMRPESLWRTLQGSFLNQIGHRLFDLLAINCIGIRADQLRVLLALNLTRSAFNGA